MMKMTPTQINHDAAYVRLNTYPLLAMLDDKIKTKIDSFRNCFMFFLLGARVFGFK